MPHDMTTLQVWKDRVARLAARTRGPIDVANPPQQADATQDEHDLKVAERHMWRLMAKDTKRALEEVFYEMKHFVDRIHTFWLAQLLFLAGIYLPVRAIAAEPYLGTTLYQYLPSLMAVGALLSVGLQWGRDYAIRQLKKGPLLDLEAQTQIIRGDWPEQGPQQGPAADRQPKITWPVAITLGIMRTLSRWKARLTRPIQHVPLRPTPPPVANQFGGTVVGRVPQMAAQAREIARAARRARGRTIVAKMRNRVEDGRLIRKDKFDPPNANGDILPAGAMQEALTDPGGITEPGVRREFAEARAPGIRAMLEAERPTLREIHATLTGEGAEAQLRAQQQREGQANVQRALVDANQADHPPTGHARGPEEGPGAVPTPPRFFRPGVTVEQIPTDLPTIRPVARPDIEIHGQGEPLDQRAEEQDEARARLQEAVERALAYPEGAPAFHHTFGELVGDALREGGEILTRDDILDVMRRGGLLTADEIELPGIRGIIREAMLQTLAMPGVETQTGLPADQLEQQTREILDRATTAVRPILRANARDVRVAERRERGDQANA